MTNEQWQTLLSVVNGEMAGESPVGFIIDSPWLPGWAGISTLDYYTSESLWLEANLKAIRTFPDVIFLPGFWSEFGMCTEPSAFGAKCVWETQNLPHAHKILDNADGIAGIEKPDVKTDGLLPFVVQRLRHAEPQIREAGHEIRFAVSRGPLNIASFLMGTTEFLMALYTHTEACEKLLQTITDFTIDWIAYQKEQFDSIDAVLLLDDIVGFVGEDDYRRFAHPYLKQIFAAFPFSVKAFHNDAKGLVCAPHLADMGVNLFNFSFEHSMNEMRELCGESVAFLGNLPPRDVLAGAEPGAVREQTEQMVRELNDRQRILYSCGGGMPQDVSTEQIQAFVEGVGDGAEA
jgi:uroporphyrinogen-III decarboxylase